MIVEGAIAATMYIVTKEKEGIAPQLPQATIEKFKKWEKEDFYKDDPYRDMWDKDWIKKK